MLDVEDTAASDRASFRLTTRVVSLDRIAILLHIFRSNVRVMSRQLDIVKSRDALHVYSRCRLDLERRGLVERDDDHASPAVAAA